MNLKIKKTISILELCRICLKKKCEVYGERMLKIFETHITTLNISLSEIFTTFTGIPLNDQPKEFPFLVCSNCQDTLVRAYEFLMKCIESDKHIRMVSKCSAIEYKIVNRSKNDRTNDSIKTEINTIFLEENGFDGDQVKNDPDLPLSCLLVKMDEDPTVTSEKQLADIDDDKTSKSPIDEITEPDNVDTSCTDSDNTQYTNLKESIKITNKNIAELGVNIKLNRDKKPLTCLVCTKIFARHSALQRHSKTHVTEGKPFECKFCKRRFTAESRMILHENKHSEDSTRSAKDENPPLFQCAECPREFLKRESLAAHMKVHPTESRQVPRSSCDYCKKSFSKLEFLERHIKIHIQSKVHRCKKCYQTFSGREQLLEHQIEHKKIESKTAHVCTICNKSYTRLSALEDHIRTHNGEIPYLCSVCGKSFGNKSSLQHHLIIHTDNKRFQCSICLIRMHTKADIKWHMITHSGIKAYTCDTCGTSFTRPGSLRRHVNRLHTNIDISILKSHLCTLCDKKFFQSNELKQHMRTHTGEKRFKCEFCARGFVYKVDLKRHQLTQAGCCRSNDGNTIQ